MTLPKSEQSSRARGKVISVLSGLVLLLALYISVCILLVLSVQRGPRIPEQSRGSPNAVLASFYDFDNTSLQQSTHPRGRQIAMLIFSTSRTALRFFYCLVCTQKIALTQIENSSLD